MTSLAQRQLAVCANPFDQATNNPKIPDGKVSQSTGMSLASISEIKLEDDTGYIVVYPGLTNNCIYWDETLGTQQVFSPANDHIDIQGTPESPPITDNVLNIPDEGIITMQQQPKFTVGQWRTVSSGVKLTMINATDDDDGWFEAIRFKPTVDKDGWTFTMGPNNTPVPVPIVTPTGAETGNGPFGFHGTTAGTKSMADRANHMTGKLCDIDRFIFNCQHQDDAHEMVKMQASYGPENYQEQLEDTIDPGMDCILIRIHGQSGECPTKLMVHTRYNLELVYDDVGILARLMTKGENAKAGLARLRSAQAKNPAPAMLNRGNFGVSYAPTKGRSYKRRRY